MTTERNAQGVDGLAEVMGLLAANAPGFELNVTKRAAVNYLRSHGEAIRELVESARAARAYSTIPATQFRELIKTMGWDGAEDTARFVSRLLDAALAKFTEPRP